MNTKEPSTLKKYETFSEFWPLYLSQHSKRSTQLIHFFGILLALIILAMAAVTGRLVLIPLAVVVGYGFAWIGHFVFEKNRPATFDYPLYSFFRDLKLFFQVLTRRI